MAVPAKRCWKATPTPPVSWKRLPLIAKVVRPGAEGVGAYAIAAVAAIPRLASRFTSLICPDNALTCVDRPLTWVDRLLTCVDKALTCVVVARPRFAIDEVARLPPPSEVTSEIGPLCAERLSTDVMPGMR